MGPHLDAEHPNLPDVGDVYVTTTDTSVTFTVVSDNYFDNPGSTITFNVVQQGGDLYLWQHGRTQETRFLARFAVNELGQARSTWNAQGDNLAFLLNHPHWTE